MVHKSRDGRSRKAAGGVAIAYRSGRCNLRRRELKSRKDGQELMCVTGKVKKVPRRVAVFVTYVPPDMRASQFRELCDTLVAEIAAVKVAMGNPIIYVTGDFNHRDASPALSLAANLEPFITLPTRGQNILDLVYANMGDLCSEARVLPPLDTATGTLSDHKCVFVKTAFPVTRDFTWVAKFRRSRNPASEQAFADDMKKWDWGAMRNAESVDAMANELEEAIAILTERHFPLARVRRRSNEDPWINKRIRRLWKKKIRLYKKYGKSQSWWETDRKLQEEIQEAKELFVERLLEDGNNGRPFFAATRKLAAASSTSPWAVTDLFVGMGPGDVCREVLDFFGGLAKSEARGIPQDLPRVDGGLGFFSLERTSELLRASKNTNSRVEGDPLQHLIRSYPDSFSEPVSELFNRINSTGRWPASWKTEHLTIIPKNPYPVDLSECRNISCTSAFSKILEGQVLIKLRAEITPDPTQYGGVPKCGVEHMLLDLWEEVLDGMEGGKNAALILGVDYEKAFNRMEHAECLDQLRLLGASAGSLSLVRAFLEDRKMQIVIDGHKGIPVEIQRGSPQGSVLGCLLYCATTQNLTKGLRTDNDESLRAGNPPDGRDGPIRPGVFMYVDDTTLTDIVPTNAATLHLSASKASAHLDNLDLERDFRVLEGRAREINMKVNAKKTQLLVIAPPNGYDTSASVDTGEIPIQSVNTLKLVGFTFGSTPGVGEHVVSVESKMKRKIWMLYKLREAGFKGMQLYKLYCCYLRSIIEYCSVVYHSLLTRGQSWDLERLQRLALRICFGNAKDTDDIMLDNDIASLEERRKRRCDVFLRKAINHPRFGTKWFQPRRGEPMNLRNRRAIEETRSRTNRRFNSPLAFLRRRANELGLVGRAVGASEEALNYV